MVSNLNQEYMLGVEPINLQGTDQYYYEVRPTTEINNLTSAVEFVFTTAKYERLPWDQLYLQLEGKYKSGVATDDHTTASTIDTHLPFFKTAEPVSQIWNQIQLFLNGVRICDNATGYDVAHAVSTRLTYDNLDPERNIGGFEANDPNPTLANKPVDTFAHLKEHGIAKSYNRSAADNFTRFHSSMTFDGIALMNHSNVIPPNVEVRIILRPRKNWRNVLFAESPELKLVVADQKNFCQYAEVTDLFLQLWTYYDTTPVTNHQLNFITPLVIEQDLEASFGKLWTVSPNAVAVSLTTQQSYLRNMTTPVASQTNDITLAGAEVMHQGLLGLPHDRNWTISNFQIRFGQQSIPSIRRTSINFNADSDVMDGFMNFYQDWRRHHKGRYCECESYHQWWMKGPIFHYPIIKDPSDRSNTLQLKMYSDIPAVASSGDYIAPSRANTTLFVIIWIQNLVNIAYDASTGVPTQVSSLE